MATILLVDDQAAGLRVLRRALEREGFDVLVAGSAEEAMDVLGLHSPSLVITDLAMPIVNGVELARRIRSEMPQVRVLAVSGDRDLLDLARADGIPGFAKPIELRKIVQEAAALLDQP